MTSDVNDAPTRAFFTPVKNAEGTDSPATCKRDQVRRAARWLRGAGVPVPETGGDPDATLEISPLYATSETQLRERWPKVKIEGGTVMYLGSEGI
jgi:UDP-N-acetylglucosamine/UDP-N-acetylgalactosamine diphosphorylase